LPIAEGAPEVVAGLTLVLWLAAAPNLASAEDVSAALHRLGAADLVLVNDPAGARPARVLLATRVAVSAEDVRTVITDPSAYGKAIPSFRRVEVVAKLEREPGIADMEVAWELEVPLRNLRGKLWLRPQENGVDLQLSEGDFAPGLFHLSARKEKPGGNVESVLTIEGFANVRDVNWATRQIAQRSPIAEPAITVAAVYVLLKSLARLAEGTSPARPGAAMAAPEPSSLNGGALAGQTVNATAQSKKVLAAVRSRADGRLSRVEVAVHVSAPADQVTRRTMQPKPFVHMPGWKKITPVSGKPDECKDTAALCWKVDTNLPVFSLDGTWKIRPRPWRARMVAGDSKGAVMGIDVVPATPNPSGGSTLVLSQHPRLDMAGYVARKLIAAEPFLEHGLALALTLVEAVSLGPALEKD
jgi:hypothetical protein